MYAFLWSNFHLKNWPNNSLVPLYFVLAPPSGNLGSATGLEFFCTKQILTRLWVWSTNRIRFIVSGGSISYVPYQKSVCIVCVMSQSTENKPTTSSVLWITLHWWILQLLQWISPHKCTYSIQHTFPRSDNIHHTLFIDFS